MICEICGRKLKSVKSLERGIGPSCWKKVHRDEINVKTSSKKRDVDPGNISIPGQMEMEEWINSMEDKGKNDENVYR